MAEAPIRAGLETVYRSTPILRQQKFPARRHSSKPPRSSNPSLQRDQSTLTQLDFCTPRPSSDAEEEDAILRDSRPRKKKRRKNEDGKRQSTLTQFDFRQPGRPVCGNAEDFEVFDEMCHGDPRDRVRDTQYPAQIEADLSEANPGQVRRTENNYCTAIRDFAVRNAIQSEIQDSQPSTPVKTSLPEVPSSQSPQSILLTNKTLRHFNSPKPSPLKERSVNIGDSSTKNASPLNAKYNSLIDDSPIKSPVFRKPEMPRRRAVDVVPDSDGVQPEESESPRLHRFNSIIQDSQLGSLGEEITMDYPTQIVVPASDRAETQATLDTQDLNLEYYEDPACSALDRDAARYMQTQRLLDQQLGIIPCTVEEHVPEMTPATYLECPNLPPNQDAEDGQDAAHGEGAEGEDETASNKTHSLPESPIKRETSPTITFPLDVEVVDLTSDETIVEDADPSTPPSSPPQQPRQASPRRTPEKHIPSSPPAFHPSQATTVDVTQRSLQPSPSPERIHRIDLFSSSPLPLPPLSSSQLGGDEYRKRQEYEIPSSSADSGFDDYDAVEAMADGTIKKKRRTAEELLPDSLLDFSLPPPPPMSSWRKRRT